MIKFSTIIPKGSLQSVVIDAPKNFAIYIMFVSNRQEENELCQSLREFSFKWITKIRLVQAINWGNTSINSVYLKFHLMILLKGIFSLNIIFGETTIAFAICTWDSGCNFVFIHDIVKRNIQLEYYFLSKKIVFAMHLRLWMQFVERTSKKSYILFHF